jgi:hypothetical protein
VSTQPIYGIPASVEHWAIALAAVAAACSLLFCVQRAVRHRSPVPLYLFAAGGLVVLMEPFCDVLGRATFPELGTLGWISTLGRHIPMYVGLIYMMYWAPAWILLGEWFEAGMRPRTFWTICAVAAAATCAIELVPLHYDLWRYYGSQGVELGGFPIWWAFINGQAVVTSSVAVWLLSRLIPRGRRFLLVVALPPITFGIHAAGALPGYTAVSSTADRATTWAGVGGSMIVSVVLLWIVSLVACRRAENPAHPPVAARVEVDELFRPRPVDVVSGR